MKNPDPGYPLPSGDLSSPDIVCGLVFYPDEVEYRRALLGSLSYLATWHAWERDSQKRGKDAAAAWRLALEYTLECLPMVTCLDDIKTELQAIKLLLQNQVCCDGTTLNYQPTTIVTTTITPNSGPAPTTYGETSVADWDEWYEHVCYQAHKYVDGLVNYAETISTVLSIGSMTIDLFGTFLQWLTFIGLPIAVFYSDAAAWFSDLIGQPATIFDDAAQDLEDGRDDIVCAIINNLDLGDAVQASLTNSNAWTYFFGLINYDSVQSLIYEGGYGGEYLETDKDASCACTFPSDYYGKWSLGDGQGSWVRGNLSIYDWATGSFSPDGASNCSPANKKTIYMLRNDMVGTLTPAIPNVDQKITKVALDYMWSSGGDSTYTDWCIKVMVQGASGLVAIYETTSNEAWDVWHHIEFTATLPKVCITSGTDYALRIEFTRSVATGNRRHRIKDVEIWSEAC